MVDLLSRSVERFGLEEASRSGHVADLFALADLSFGPEARAGLAARLEGLQRAAEAYGLETSFIETAQPTDYEKNIEQFAQALFGRGGRPAGPVTFMEALRANWLIAFVALTLFILALLATLV